MERTTSSFDSNPFFIYIVAFSIPLCLYALDWSYLYPDLSTELIMFFLITFIISLAIGLYINNKKVIQFSTATRKLNLAYLLIGLTIGNSLNFLYEGRIPLFSVVNLIKQENYGTFGIPSFAVLISTLGSFFTAYFYYYYLVTKDKKYLFASLFLFIFPIMIFSRGILLLNLSNILFIYIFSIKKDKLKSYLKIIGLILVVLLVFGYAGNLRSNTQLSQDENASRLIMSELGQAKPSFINSSIPPEFFWSYIYISSPLANLQYNIDTYPVEYNGTTFFRYLNYDLIFDSISKRIGEFSGIEKIDNNLIAPYLTVGTVFANSFTDFGWLGMCFTFLFIMGVCFVYIVYLKPNNPFYVVGMSVLNTLVLFNLFDNMLTFTALSLQLLYPFIFNIKFKMNNHTQKYNA